MSLQEILAGGKRYVSNPALFCEFMKGLKVGYGLLLDQRLTTAASASGGFMLFNFFLHEILPEYYNVRHLEAMGRRFALRLNGVGDYTVTALNRRVVTFKGLPISEATKTLVIDVEMRPEVFIALCNEIVAQLSERVLLSTANLQPVPAIDPVASVVAS
jgi:hypothetical protein